MFLGVTIGKKKENDGDRGLPPRGNRGIVDDAISVRDPDDDGEGALRRWCSLGSPAAGKSGMLKPPHMCVPTAVLLRWDPRVETALKLRCSCLPHFSNFEAFFYFSRADFVKKNRK